jgi:sarcosine reductase
MMRLEIGTFPVARILFGRETRLDGDVLTVDKNELERLVLEDPRISHVEIEIVEPGQSARVIHVCDAIEPRIKVQGPGVCYPGWLGPVDTVGQGVTHRLHGMAVVLSAEYPRLVKTGVGAPHEAILDMSGPGALSPLSHTHNLVLVLTLAPGYSYGAYNQALRLAGLKASHRLAQTTLGKTPPEYQRYELTPVNADLPKIVYVHQIFTQLNLPAPYFTWYGMYITDWMPLWVHPNEIMDGALLPSTVGSDAVQPTSWEHVNNPVILRLYAGHGLELKFLGVILQRTRFEVSEEKQLSANQTAKLAKLMGAEGAIITWVGAGNAFIESMLTMQQLEREGIKTVFMTYEHGGKEGLEAPLMFTVPEADALISVGSLDRPLTLPPVDHVVGGQDLSLDPEASDWRIPAVGEINLDWRLPIVGGVDPWGFGRQMCVEY